MVGLRVVVTFLWTPEAEASFGSSEPCKSYKEKFRASGGFSARGELYWKKPHRKSSFESPTKDGDAGRIALNTLPHQEMFWLTYQQSGCWEHQVPARWSN